MLARMVASFRGCKSSIFSILWQCSSGGTEVFVVGEAALTLLARGNKRRIPSAFFMRPPPFLPVPCKTGGGPPRDRAPASTVKRFIQMHCKIKRSLIDKYSDGRVGPCTTSLPLSKMRCQCGISYVDSPVAFLMAHLHIHRILSSYSSELQVWSSPRGNIEIHLHVITWTYLAPFVFDDNLVTLHRHQNSFNIALVS